MKNTANTLTPQELDTLQRLLGKVADGVRRMIPATSRTHVETALTSDEEGRMQLRWSVAVWDKDSDVFVSNHACTPDAAIDEVAERVTDIEARMRKLLLNADKANLGIKRLKIAALEGVTV